MPFNFDVVNDILGTNVVDTGSVESVDGFVEGNKVSSLGKVVAAKGSAVKSAVEGEPSTVSKSAVEGGPSTVGKPASQYNEDRTPGIPAKTSKRSKSEQFLYELDQDGYDMEYLEPFLKGTGNMLSISSAGSGKTTSLLFKVIYDFLSGRMMERGENGVPAFLPVWVGTFLKSGQEDLKRQLHLKSRYLKGIDLSRHVQVNTLHSEFYHVCALLGYSTDIIDDRENRRLFDKAMRECGMRFFNKADLDAAYSDVINQRGSTMVSAAFSEVNTVWKNLRYRMGKVDFEDLQEILYNRAVVKAEPELVELLANRYRRIYLDEFQDVSRIQYEILKVYQGGKGQAEDGYSGNTIVDRQSGAVIAIGDDDQSIYSWRGADIQFLTRRFPVDFHAKVYQNPKNYRTPSTILDAVIPCIERNKERYEKPLKSATVGGEIRYCCVPDYNTMCNTLTRFVQEDLARGKSVTVLVRVNSDGLMPAMALSREGVPCTLSSAEMTLSGSVGTLARGFVDLANNRYNDGARKALKELIPNTQLGNAMSEYMEKTRCGLWDISEEDILYSFGDKNKTLAGFLLKLSNKANKCEGSPGKGILVSLVDKYLDMLGKKKQTQYVERIKSVFSSLKEMCNSLDNDATVQDVAQTLDELRTALDVRYKSRDKVVSSLGVTIGSVHEYKGKECDSVYIWNASRGIYPLHRVLMEQGDAGLEEERRIFYIACTRAKELETILTLEGSESRFLKEMDLSQAGEVAPVVSLGGVLNSNRNLTEDEIF